MNRVAACIKLIQILSSRNDYINTKELAEILETNPRNIREYIKELEVAGYTVKSVQGIYGGYKLDKSTELPQINLSSDELNALREALPKLRENDFKEYEALESAVGKITSGSLNHDEITPVTMLDKFPLSMSKSELNKRYMILNECITSQMKVEILYTSSLGGSLKHVIHPYKLFIYNGGYFVLAYNETVDDFGYFKLNRIDDIFKTRNHFSLVKTYNESDYLDSFGMTKNGEYYDIELEIYGMNTSIKEKVYGRNQRIVEHDDNHLTLSCQIQNKNIIKAFVLSLGNQCVVKSPDWLKEEIRDALWSMMEKYE